MDSDHRAPGPEPEQYGAQKEYSESPQLGTRNSRFIGFAASCDAATDAGGDLQRRRKEQPTEIVANGE